MDRCAACGIADKAAPFGACHGFNDACPWRVEGDPQWLVIDIAAAAKLSYRDLTRRFPYIAAPMPGMIYEITDDPPPGTLAAAAADLRAVCADLGAQLSEVFHLEQGLRLMSRFIPHFIATLAPLAWIAAMLYGARLFKDGQALAGFTMMIFCLIVGGLAVGRTAFDWCRR